MELKIYQNIMRVFNTLILILTFQFSFACGGWEVPSEVYRFSMFNAQRKEFYSIERFNYSGEILYDEQNNDWKINCLEWKNKLGNNIKESDVYTILYDVCTLDFTKSYLNRTLKQTFKGNTFIKTLLLPKNKAYLDYLLLAKKQGDSHDAWSLGSYFDIKYCKKKISTSKDFFLKQRYAFLILRETFGCDEKEANKIYNTYFKGKKTILQKSALYYKTEKIEDDSVRDYEYSKIFLHSGDYCLNVKNAIGHSYGDGNSDRGYSLAKNNDERATILGMSYLQNPAPCLAELKEMAQLEPNNILLSFLIKREINKIEDWILTPEYTNEVPAVTFNFYDTWYKDYEKAKKENYAKDILYLKKVRSVLISMHAKTKGEQRDYISAAISQLCFIDNEIDLGKKYANMISNNATLSIQMQKNIQLALVTLKGNDLRKEEVRNQLAVYLNTIEKLAKKNNESYKTLYSLYRVASREFSKNGDQAVAGLFYIKAEIAKTMDAEYGDFELGHYDYLGYFERHASIKDADYLIKLTQKHNRTSFEKFLCSNALFPNVNLYKDLKGTMAFRNNDLELAYETFVSMPISFWKKNKPFCKYLNEDPFVPKAIVRTEDRKLDYVFNKADFINKLIELKKQNTPESYIKLANAYYNVSYFGNSWMMISYDRFNIDDSNPYFVYCDDNQKLKDEYQDGNYYNLILAKKYYEKALKLSSNKEEKAFASLMLFRCKYDRYQFSDFNSYEVNYFPIIRKQDQHPFCSDFFSSYDNIRTQEFTGIQELVNFYSIYKSTKTFKKYDCPLLKEFIN